jgi:two-component system cell cycle sensor histidine kinase/response regulator CckA
MNSSDIYATAFENLRGAVLLLEKATGSVIDVNPAFLRMCGRPRDAVVGHSFWAPPLISDAEAGAEVFDHLRESGSVEGVELPLETADGSRRLLELSGGDLGGGTIQLELRDTTARAEARVAERMDSQRSLAARMAGEFTGMHRALQAASEIAANCARRGETTFLASDEIRKAADHAGVVARELLSYGRQLTLETCRLQLNDLVEDMQPALRQMLGQNIELVLDLSREAAPVTADPAQVRQILLKLAANSGEAMADGGELRIVTRNVPGDVPALGRALGGDAYTMLEVGDRGPGLDDQSWEHLFEPFFTTKPHGRRGLGLAAVHGIVRQMGGRLWAHSETGKGACFRIYLPRAGAASGPARILLMERDEGLRTVVSNILRKRGYCVLVASAANDAREMAETHGPPDLLIGEAEPDLVKRLGSLQPQLRTLILNGRSDHEEIATLDKPFEVEMLVRKVRELLGA